MRAACPWSSVCKLGSPSMTPPPPKPPASDSRRTLAPPSGSAHCVAAPQSWCPNLGKLALFPGSPSQAPLPRTAASRLLATVSSSSNKAIPALLAPGKTRPRSGRFVPVLKTDSTGSQVPLRQATVSVSSVPSGADVEVDGKFVGNTPSSLVLATGDHTIKVSKKGYKSWERTLTASTGSVNLTAELEVDK